MKYSKPALFGLVLLTAVFLVAAGAMAQSWTKFKADFIQADGRVVDVAMGGISHSEGQGYGMLLAVHHDDPATFEALRLWTKDNLMCRDDGLVAWSWGRRANGAWDVIDLNNASDGDLLIAYALLGAAERWQRPDYQEQALGIIGALRQKMAVHLGKGIFLLPGYYGFSKGDSRVVNPGYFVFPAFRWFARVDEPVFWNAVLQSAESFLTECAQTSLALPPDWVTVEKGRIAILAERSRNFGYEAIRVPLYLALDGNRAVLEMFRPYLRLVGKLGYLPRVVDLVGNSFSLEEGPAGFYAVFARCAEVLGEKELTEVLWRKAQAAIGREQGDYYSSALYLLAQGGQRP